MTVSGYINFGTANVFNTVYFPIYSCEVPFAPRFQALMKRINFRLYVVVYHTQFIVVKNNSKCCCWYWCPVEDLLGQNITLCFL